MKNIVKIFFVITVTFCFITIFKIYLIIGSYPHINVLKNNSLFTLDFAKELFLNNYISVKDYIINELDWRISNKEDSLTKINIYVPPRSFINLHFNQRRNNLISKFYPILHKQKYKAYHLNNNLKDSSKIQLRNVGVNRDHYINPKHTSLRIRFGTHSNSFGSKAFKNILRRETRKYSFDFFANVIYNQLCGGLKINSEPINFIMNGVKSPLFLMEDGFDKYLIEKNRNREGSIIEVGFNGKIDDFEHNYYKENSKLHNYNYKTNDTLFVDKFIKDMNTGNIPFLKIDQEKLNCLILICFDFFGIHPLYDTNLHWYHNPVSNLMEPTIRETSIDSNFTIKKYIKIRKKDFISTYLKKTNLNLDSLRNVYYKNFNLEYTVSKMKKWDDLYQPDLIKDRITGVIKELKNHNIKLIKHNTGIKTRYLNGESTIEKDLIINSDETLDISNLKKLIFKNDANFYLYGKIINRSDKKSLWKVENGSSSIYIKSNNNITLKNIDFYGFSNLQETESNHYLPSAITFYKTNVTIDKCSFTDNKRGDDYINFFRCDSVLVKNSNFKNILADAIDSDFSNFKILNSSFSNIGNDGIDASGSIGDIKDSLFDKIFDKAISGGELSKLNVSNINIINSEIGIVSKDGCFINFNNVGFDNNKLNVAAYTKKIEYPKAEIYSSDLIQNYLFEKNILTNISNKTVDDVYSLMYGNKYGKESK